MKEHGLSERQEIEACLSCRLPECIPDHPRCPVSGVRIPWDKDRRIWLCMSCRLGSLILTADLTCRFYFKCSVADNNTVGLYKTCPHFKVIEGLTSYRRKTERDGVTNATRYHAVQAVRGVHSGTQ